MEVAPAGGVVVGAGGQVEAAGTHHEEQSAAPSDDLGFMQDIGFGQFFTDVGLQTSASEGLAAHPGQFAQGFAGAGGIGHLAGPHFGLGVASSQQQPHAHGGKGSEDSSAQGFIPDNPLSLGQHSGPSQPPGDFKPVHQASQASRPREASDETPPSPRLKKPSSPKYQEIRPSQPEYHEGRPSYDEYEERRPYGAGSHSPRDEEYRQQGEEQEEREDDYSYAPTHQEERRPRPSYDDSGDHSYDSSRAHGERRRPQYDHRHVDGDHDDRRYHRYSPRQDDHRSESRPAAQYKGDEEGAGKCKEVEKDGMTCEICEDDEGGYSEHCSHSTRRGKDSLYSNSRQGAFKERGPDVYPPSHGRHRERGRDAYAPSHGRSTKTEAERRIDVIYAPPTYAEDFGKEKEHDPFPEDSKYDPYSFSDVLPAESKYDSYDSPAVELGHDDPDDFGHVDKDDYFGHVEDDDDDYFGPVKSDDFGLRNDHGDGYDLGRPEKEEPKKSDSHKKPVYVELESFEPLDHEDNVTELSKIMKDFNKKSRASCKKVSNACLE
nr:uncharacterized protein At5g39570-like [Penaeus vannamei]